ncbi:MAG: hypothetical protein ACYDDT_14555, partial [Sulfuricella sp.]
MPKISISSLLPLHRNPVIQQTLLSILSSRRNPRTKWGAFLSGIGLITFSFIYNLYFFNQVSKRTTFVERGFAQCPPEGGTPIAPSEKALCLAPVAIALDAAL